MTDIMKSLQKVSLRDFGSVVDDSQLVKLIEKYGVRYVIRNYKLSNNAINEIINNRYSSISEEDDIDYHEISEYQKKLK